ncbi:MAG: hypothetical protein ACLFU4_00655 [Opitutales bacterium]
MGTPLKPEATTAARLHPRVVHALNEIATELSESGLELFLFGSVAQTYPYVRKGADLDLGLHSIADFSSEAEHKIKRLAVSRLLEIPTIRPLDIVDFDTAGERFKNLAMETRLEFPLPADESDN